MIIKGAIPNHAKKHEKNANHVMWKVLICTIFTLKKLRHRLVALFCSSIDGPSQLLIKFPANAGFSKEVTVK